MFVLWAQLARLETSRDCCRFVGITRYISRHPAFDRAPWSAVSPSIVRIFGATYAHEFVLWNGEHVHGSIFFAVLVQSYFKLCLLFIYDSPCAIFSPVFVQLFTALLYIRLPLCNLVAERFDSTHP